MSRKVFTADEVLTAADVNSFLMDQTVMSFAGTAARGSAIPVPVEGMYTHLEDTDRLQFWNGSAWTNAAVATGAGLVHLRTTTFTGVTSVSLGSNADPVFSSLYDHYRIIVSSEASSGTDRSWSLRMRVNTTDATGSIYNVMNQGINRVGNLITTTASGTTLVNIMPNSFYAGERSTVSFDLLNPFIGCTVTGHGNLHGIDANHFFHQSFSFSATGTTVYNGFSIINSVGNFVNGTVSVYGYRKS
jgi:hypothetical protein